MIFDVWTILNPILRTFIYLSVLTTIGTILFSLHFSNFFDNIVKVYSKNISQMEKSKFLDFLTIETIQMPDNNYEMKLVFSGNSMIKVISEVIDVTLDDQGEAWDTKNMPKHMDI